MRTDEIFANNLVERSFYLFRDMDINLLINLKVVFLSLQFPGITVISFLILECFCYNECIQGND